MKIRNVKAIEVLDSRGTPTIESFVELENGTVSKASVPSGASTGKYEAYELRDNDPDRYFGKGVQKAVNNVNNVIAKEIIGLDVSSPEKIDLKMLAMDGTENKTHLGANAILSVSLAVFRSLASTLKIPLWKALSKYYFPSYKTGFPRLMVNVVNGGKHANWSFDIQEFMICPKDTLPSKALQIAGEVFHQLAGILSDRKLGLLVGDEGGFSPVLSSNIEVFEILMEATKKSRHKPGVDVDFAIDAAASGFYDNGKYFFKKEKIEMIPQELINYYLSLKAKYPIISFEDPFAEDDWNSFTIFTEKSNSIVVGDDLYTTNVKRIAKGIERHATNAVLIKLNQIGTLYETVEAIGMCKKNNLQTIISHRSGETEDSFISDLSYACGSEFIKAGSVTRSERLAKYNRLIEIEEREI
jgi:enolase